MTRASRRWNKAAAAACVEPGETLGLGVERMVALFLVLAAGVVGAAAALVAEVLAKRRGRKIRDEQRRRKRVRGDEDVCVKKAKTMPT